MAGKNEMDICRGQNALGNWGEERAEDIRERLIEKQATSEPVEVTRGITPDTEEVTLDSAITELDSLIDEYGFIEYTFNEEYVDFVEKIHNQEIITDEEYNRIRTRTSFGSNIRFVKDLLEEKRAALVGVVKGEDECVENARWVDRSFNPISGTIQPSSVYIEVTLESSIDKCRGYTIAVGEPGTTLFEEYEINIGQNLVNGKYYQLVEVNTKKSGGFLGLFQKVEPAKWKFRIQDSERNEIFEGNTITVSEGTSTI